MSRPELTFRPAGLDDIPAIAELLGMLFADEQDFAPDPAKQHRALTLFLEAGKGIIYLAECGGRCAGVVIASLGISTAEGGWSGDIDDIVVHPDFRRLGIGEQLLAMAEEWCYRHGAVRMRLYCDDQNHAAMAFYRKHGWQKSHCVAFFRRR